MVFGARAEGPSTKRSAMGDPPGWRCRTASRRLNLPAAEKFSSTPITTLRDKAEFPIIETEEAYIKVLEGEAFGQASPTGFHSPAFYHHVHLYPGAPDLPAAESTPSSMWSRGDWRWKEGELWPNSSRCTNAVATTCASTASKVRSSSCWAGSLWRVRGVLRSVCDEQPRANPAVHRRLPGDAGGTADRFAPEGFLHGG